MRRKKPEIGDVVRIDVEMDRLGLVVECIGIQLHVRMLAAPNINLLVRRDSVEVISRANSH